MHPFVVGYSTPAPEMANRKCGQKKNLARVWKKVELIKVFTLQYECNSNHPFPFDILFRQNNIHKSSCGLCFSAPDPLIDRFYKDLLINGSETKNKGHTNFYECYDLTKKHI